MRTLSEAIRRLATDVIKMITLLALITPAPKSTPAHFTPALIPPRANFDLPPFRAAFNATIGKNQKKGKVFNLQ